MRSSIEKDGGTPKDMDALVRGRKWKERLGIAAVSVLAIAIAAGSASIYIRRRQAASSGVPDVQDTAPGTGAGRGGDPGVVVAVGTTSVGVDAVTFSIDFLEDTSLYVEEVYVANGDSVEAGDKYIRFTEESIADARNELRSAALSAQLAYRSGLITDGESRLQAQYTYDMAMLEAQFAQQVYDDTIAQLDADYAQSAKAYDQAQQEYDSYLARVEGDTFYEDYQIADLKKAYEEAKELYVDRRAYHGVTDDELGSSPSGSTGTMALSGAAGEGAAPAPDKGTDPAGAIGRREDQAAQDERKWIVKTVSLLEQEAEEAEERYMSALEGYEDEIASAELTLQKLWNDLEAAREDFADAEVDYQEQSLHAKTTYETSVAKGRTAQADHDTQITSLDDSLDRLRDAKEEADSNLALFEELVGDGCLYMERSGTVLMLMAEEGRALTGGSMIFAYSDPEQLSVSVSVSQEDIARLCVGERASVFISEHGEHSGVIKTIDPIAASDSRSSVSYTVTVELQGDVSGLDADLTANVIFGGDASSAGVPDEEDLLGNAPKSSGEDVGAISKASGEDMTDGSAGTSADGEEDEHGKPGRTDR